MTVYGCGACSLRVRVTNRAAFTLYKEVLGYTVHGTDKAYYADKEDAYDMRVKFEHPGDDSDAEAKEAEILDSAKAVGGNVVLAESSGKQGKKKQVDEKEESKASETATDVDSVQAAKNAEKNRKKREK